MINSRGPAPGDARESSQDARTTSGSQPLQKARLIPIQRDLLMELDACQTRLDAYMKGYLALRPQVDAYQGVSGVLSFAKQDRSRLSDHFYLGQLSNAMRSLRRLSDLLSPVLLIVADDDDVVRPSVTQHDGDLAKAQAAIRTLTNPSQDADPDEAIGMIFQSIEQLGEPIDSLSSHCQRLVDRNLGQIGKVIANIFAIEQNRQLSVRGMATPVRRKKLADLERYGATETAQLVKSDPRPEPGDRQAEIGSKSASKQEGWTWRSK